MQCGGQGHGHERPAEREDQVELIINKKPKPMSSAASAKSMSRSTLGWIQDQAGQPSVPANPPSTRLRQDQGLQEALTLAQVPRYGGGRERPDDVPSGADVPRKGLGDDAPVPSDERRERSSSVRRSVGAMNPTSFKDLKKGVKTLMKDAIIRAQTNEA